MLMQALGGICVLATILVRLTPGKGDDEKVLKYVSMYSKFLAKLPTLWVNPRTKKLEEYLKSLNS